MTYLWKLTLTHESRDDIQMCLKLFKTKRVAERFAVRELNEYITSTRSQMDEQTYAEYIYFIETEDVGYKFDLNLITVEEFKTSMFIISNEGYRRENSMLGFEVKLEKNTSDCIFYLVKDKF